MHVRVDIARQDEFADATDLFSERRAVLLPHRDAFDLVAVNNHRGIRQHFAIGGINYSRTDQRNFFGTRRQCEA